MQENRSFDHYLGWLPGADATQSGTYLDEAGTAFSTEDWGATGRGNFAGHGYEDPSHSWTGGRLQLGGDARDASGFALGKNDELALAYYGADDLPAWRAFTNEGTTFDRYFASLLGPTYPNRYYMHGATSEGRKTNAFASDPIEGYRDVTLWDHLDAAGVSWRYYYSNAPVIALYGQRYVTTGNVRHISEYYADCLAGSLPRVSFVDPFFLADDVGLSNDDHPHADLRLGQQFLAGVARAFSAGPQWSRGALFVNYDEWGGFFDHAVPPSVPDDRQSLVLDEDFGQLGFRTPACVLSPYARRGAIVSRQYDHTSILRFIAYRFGIKPWNLRLANTANIGQHVFDLDRPDFSPLAVPLYLAPPEARMPGVAGSPSEKVPSALTDPLPFEVPELPAVVEEQPIPPPTPWPHHPEPGELWYDLAHTGIAESLGYRIDWRFDDSFFAR
jgi:phospholipase C